MRIASSRPSFNIPPRPRAAPVQDSFERAARPATPKPSVMVPQKPVQQTEQPEARLPFERQRMFELPVAGSFLLEGIAEGSMAEKFMTAAATGDADTVRDMLARHDVLPDFSNRYGITPLMAASARGHDAVVEVLAAHPLVNLRKKASNEWTALHFAAHYGQEEAVRSLLRHHAPVDAETTHGTLPHQLAENNYAGAVFWQDKNFIRFMKRHQPDHERLQAAKQQTPQGEEPQSPPAAPTLPEPVKSVGEVLHKKISKGGTPVELFIEAARTGDVAVMEELHGQAPFRQDILDKALARSVADGDYPAAVHRLMLWGANAEAPSPGTSDNERYPVRSLALVKKRLGALEEMILWSQSPKDWKDFVKNLMAVAASKQPDGALEDNKELILTGSIWTSRKEYHRLGGNKLKWAFADAVEREDFRGVMAAYAESRVDRFIRGTVDMGKDSDMKPEVTADAIALALLNRRFEFARKMIADGHHLKHASVTLMARLLYNEDKEIGDFATDHLSGKLEVKKIEEIGKFKPSTLYIPPPMGMSRYGMG